MYSINKLNNNNNNNNNNVDLLALWNLYVNISVHPLNENKSRTVNENHRSWRLLSPLGDSFSFFNWDKLLELYGVEFYNIVVVSEGWVWCLTGKSEWPGELKCAGTAVAAFMWFMLLVACLCSPRVRLVSPMYCFLHYFTFYHVC